MKLLHSRLQTYFEHPLPEPEKLREAFTLHFSEVEDVSHFGGDTVYDLKILPDRANYALCHRGAAREVSAIFSLPMKSSVCPAIPRAIEGEVSVSIQEPTACRRYISALVEHVSPRHGADAKAFLTAIGERPINAIVDAANFIMFDLGQPLHAFDADRVVGRLTVRCARDGEKIETLDGQTLQLKPSILIIADEKGPIAVAGIKGGKRAAVTSATKRVLLEAALFDPVVVRRAADNLQLHTEASRRFENGISSELASEAMAYFVQYLGAHTVSRYTDYYPVHEKPRRIRVSLSTMNSILGSQISSPDVESVFQRLQIRFISEGSGVYELLIPSWRLDLDIPEDIAEEVGRIIGYDSLPSPMPKHRPVPKLTKQYVWTELVKDFLVSRGFFEVITRSFQNAGEMETLKPLASDKRYLRSRLMDGISDALESNIRHADLLELDEIRLFEIGRVFPKVGERSALGVGVRYRKQSDVSRAREEIKKLRDDFIVFLGAPVNTACTIDDTGGILLMDGKQMGMINHEDGILEIWLDPFFDVLPDRGTSANISSHPSAALYTPISSYPSITRDVSFFVGAKESFADITSVIKELVEAGSLPNLVRIPSRAFDEFKDVKTGKTSFAFRLVFQSSERTLTDAEVNSAMQNLYNALGKKAWSIR